MYNCKNLKVRQKNYQKYYYCKFHKQQITLVECESCSNRIVVRNKGIKKVGKNRIKVKDEIYFKVIERDMGCQLANNECKGRLELHHIVYRSENKNLINDVNNCIMLCLYHHKLVHSNKKYWQPKLKQIIKEKRQWNI